MLAGWVQGHFTPLTLYFLLDCMTANQSTTTSVNMSSKTNLLSRTPKAIIFDLMGTCCDWHSSLLPALQASPSLPLLPASELSKFATDWRAGFFEEIHARFQAGEPAEDIDVTHRRVLDQLLDAKGVDETMWDEDVRRKLVDQWHFQRGPALYWFLRVVADADKDGRMHYQVFPNSARGFSCMVSVPLKMRKF